MVNVGGFDLAGIHLAEEVSTVLSGGSNVWNPNSTSRGVPDAKMKVRDLLKKLAEEGWILKNTEGSHRQFVHPTKPGKVTVNGHPSDEVPQGTLKSILKQAGLK